MVRLRSNVMTIGQLSRRTGVSIKILREYEQLGFLYTLGRSDSNYRLFGEEAVWCVQVIQGLRSLGLTLKEVKGIAAAYRGESCEPTDALLEKCLAQAATRVEARIADLRTLQKHILDFQAARAHAGPSPSASELVRLLASDPRRADARSTSR